VSSAQILTRHIEGGSLTLISTDREIWETSVDGHGPTVITFVRGSSNESSTSETAGSILDMVRHPMAWNMFKATFEAAAILVERGPAAVAEGISMLQWIYACTQLIASESSTIQAEAKDLAYQSSALLVLLAGGASAPYVPILSQDFYKDRISGLLNVVQSYEEKCDALQTQENIEQAVNSVAGALDAITKAESAAIQVSINNTQAEALALMKQYGKLLGLYNQQKNDIKLKQIIFQHGLEEKQVWTTVKAVIGAIEAVLAMAAAVGALAIAPEAAPEAAAGAAKGAEAAAKGAESAAQAAEAAENVSTAWSELAKGVTELKKLQDKLSKVLKAGAYVYEAANRLKTVASEDTTGPDLTAPDWAEIATTDPALQWTLFGSKVENALNPSVDSGVDGASDYLNSLRILIEYGKSLNTKAVALAVLEGHSLELRAQSDAAQFAQRRWALLANAATTMLQKQAALQALLNAHLVNAKRSLFLCAKGFAAAYFYRYLVEPTFQFAVTMTYLELTTQCAELQRGIENLLTHDPPDQPFDTGYFTIPVVRTTAPNERTPSVSRALLNTAGPNPTLIWSIPINRPPFEGTVPNHTNMGVFVVEGWFYLLGAKPNSFGTVMLTVSTSGAYSNGYGKTGTALRFISPSFSMNFIYKPKFDGSPSVRMDGYPIDPISPWQPDNPRFYLNPSPFTEWLIVVNDAGSLDGLTAITMRLRGIYHQPVGASRSN